MDDFLPTIIRSSVQICQKNLIGQIVSTKLNNALNQLDG